jgi:hypothetical protein
MKKRFSPLFALALIIFLGSCLSTKTAQLSNQNDDVYYSVAKAKEIVPQTYVQNEVRRNNDYVTDENLYGDAVDSYGYYNDYASRFNRFGTFAPSLGYYNSIYGFNYDPFYNNMFFPNAFGGGFGFNNGFGLGFGSSFGFGSGFGMFGYNPWRPFGFNYGFGSNFWGPASFYNPYNAFAFGNGYYGGIYSGIYSSPAFIAPNFRTRPDRATDNLGINRGSVAGNPNGIGSNYPNNGTIQRSRTERYGVQTQANPGSTQNSGARTQQVNRPERVSQNQPQRAPQAERVYTSPPRQDSGSSSGSRSNNTPSSSGGGSSARPSRGN